MKLLTRFYFYGVSVMLLGACACQAVSERAGVQNNGAVSSVDQTPISYVVDAGDPAATGSVEKTINQPSVEDVRSAMDNAFLMHAWSSYTMAGLGVYALAHLAGVMYLFGVEGFKTLPHKKKAAVMLPMLTLVVYGAATMYQHAAFADDSLAFMRKFLR